MGTEWDLACVSCRNWVWLGSLKPWKWNGFQMGNRLVAEFFSVHAQAGCSLIVTSDARTFDPPWEHDAPATGWHEDLRSRWFWDSSRLDTRPPQMVCAACRALLSLPSGPDAEQLRQAGYDPAPGAAKPLIMGRYLWFCGPDCRQRYLAAPGRTWREAPGPSFCLKVVCQCGHTQASLNGPEPEPGDALAFAEWLAEHLFDPPAGSTCDAESGCRLTAQLEANAPSDPAAL